MSKNIDEEKMLISADMKENIDGKRNVDMVSDEAEYW